MNAVEYRFLEPLDVLFLRGNKLFGDPGSYGESLVPPWPSVAAGALRSRMLTDDGVDLVAFAAGRVVHPVLGTPDQPGTFQVTSFQMARRLADGRVEPLIAPPADLVIGEQDGKVKAVRALSPTRPAAGVLSSSPLPMLPVLAETERGKAAAGYWLTAAGWRTYLAGHTPLPGDLIKSSQLWCIDPRVGVGLDASTRRAADGRLFSVQAVAMQPGVGFLAGIAGAAPPASGLVRFGGDGRAAAIHPAAPQTAAPDYGAIARAGRCRLVLATPGIFPAGWTLPGTDAAGRFHLGEVSGRLVCAAVTRAEIVSGWDLALWQPKSARRAAPAGSVYWLDDVVATPEALRKLAASGLWDAGGENRQRQAEGFNRFTFAAY
ncbi:MAG: type III-B CRISPR module-associated protein Cmr3 [Chromatiaceae bacterium]|nr:type III-B CRISPR module-associated protein Cmr3 [Chromatiaceae bacterium]